MDSIINDIFEKYQIRKTAKQKTAFIEYAEQKIKEEGYSVQTEKGSFGVRNIVVGNPDSASVIFTAHYDTCPRLPFPNFLSPKNIGVYLLYNLAIILGFFVIAILIGLTGGIIGAALGISSTVVYWVSLFLYLGLMLLMYFGPANKHTANDNTSGVTVLFGIMKALPPELREKVAFVFFDCEETGLIGSTSFAQKHKNVKNDKLLLNFDCVSDGRDMMILTKKYAKPYSKVLANAFQSNGDITVDITDKALYPSDQEKFKKGVGVAAFKRTKGGMLYVNRIHTNKDTVYRRENIDFLIDGSVKLAELL